MSGGGRFQNQFGGPWPLRRHLVLLVIGTLLPVTAFSVVVVRRLADDQRGSAERRLARSAHELSQLVDREMAGTMRALDALARSERLEHGDLHGFYNELQRALPTQPSWAMVILLSPDGQQIFSTRYPYGQTLPRVIEPDSFERTVRTFRPSVGSLAPGKSNDNKLAFPVRVPVVRDGKLQYVLTAVMEPKAVADLVARQRSADDGEWTRAIVDSHGTIIARTRDPEKFVGKSATPAFYAHIRATGDGAIRSTTLDGLEAYTGFSRAALSDWDGIVVVPAAYIDGPARRFEFGLAGAGVAMLVISAAGAYLVSRRLARGIASAAAAADALASGQSPTPLPPTRVAEIDHLGEALRRSADLLADRERQRNEHLARADAARADAEAASRAKDEFLAMLGHELRNPLAPIRTGVHLLGTLPPGDDRTESVRQTIERQADHMTRLVDDLLDASRVSRGKVDLDLRPLDLRSVVRDVTTDFRAQFDTANVSLDTELPTDTPVPVNGDPTRLAQCLGNLLHNALKYTPPRGHVRVTLAADPDVSHATLTVQDDGAGIDRDLLTRLFQPFAQGPQSPARPHGGLGLGLALVRGFIALHHGTVSAHSLGPNQGSTFTLTLPLLSSHAGAERSAALDSPSSPLATGNSPLITALPRRVLIVEDLHDAARTLKLLLAIDGHDVRTAGTAADALAAAPDFAPDVIVCDIGLPDMDGYDLCRHLRRLPACRSSRLIALTGYGQSDDVARATAAGFDLHLTKPVDVPTLRSAVSAAAPALPSR